MFTQYLIMEKVELLKHSIRSWATFKYIPPTPQGFPPTDLSIDQVSFPRKCSRFDLEANKTSYPFIPRVSKLPKISPLLSSCSRTLQPLPLHIGVGVGSLGRSSRSPVLTVALPASVRSSSVSGRRESTNASGTLYFPLGIPTKALVDGGRANLIGARDLALLLFLVLFSFGVAVEVQIDHHVPLCLPRRESASQTQHLAGQHPPDQPDRVATLVVRWNSNVDVFGWRVGVAEGNDGDVDVGRFFDGLGVGARIRDHDQARFLEGARDVVGEVAGSEATCDRGGSCMCGEFEHGSLAVRTAGDNSNVSRVVDCNDEAGCEDELLPVLY